MNPRSKTTEPSRRRSSTLVWTITAVAALAVVGGSWFALTRDGSDVEDPEQADFISVDAADATRITIASPPQGPTKDDVSLVTTTGEVAFTSGGCVELDWWDGTEWTDLGVATYQEAREGIWSEPPLTQACTMELIISTVALPPQATPGTYRVCGAGSTSCTAFVFNPDDMRSAEMMAAAIRELVTKDHTFGSGPPPFTEYLIQTSLDPRAGSIETPEVLATRELTDTERTAIEDALAGLGPVRWIDSPSKWRTDSLQPVIEGSVILGVGEPAIEDGTGLVAVSLWCGGTCGTWFTYRISVIDGTWQVVGKEGPFTIS